MWCFMEWNGAKYWRLKCNERTIYTVLGEPNSAITKWECNAPCIFLKNLSILFRFWWAFYYCIWFFCFERCRGLGWIPFFKTPYFKIFSTNLFNLFCSSLLNLPFLCPWIDNFAISIWSKLLLSKSGIFICSKIWLE